MIDKCSSQSCSSLEKDCTDPVTHLVCRADQAHLGNYIPFCTEHAKTYQQYPAHFSVKKIPSAETQ